jgi:beta-1,4-mannosyl-glycoprotein beta-1,4-N-acetylglucosaminyltransferase
MIIDGFIFFNELDLLEIRLNELNSVVDFLFLVESTKNIFESRKTVVL